MPAVVSADVVVPAAPASAARSPERIAEDCANARPAMEGDYMYWVPDCRVEVVSGTETFAAPKVVGQVALACNSSGGSSTVNASSSTSTSFSFGLDIGAKRKFGDLEGQVGAKLGWTWSWSQSRGWAVSVRIPGWSVGWIESRDAVRKLTVNIKADYDDGRGFAETARNQVIYAPDPNNDNRWVLRSRPLTDWEIKNRCGNGLATGTGLKFTPAPAPAVASEASIAAPDGEVSALAGGYGPDFRFWVKSQGRLLSTYSSKCMTVHNGASADGTRIVQNDCKPDRPKEQLWETVKRPDGPVPYVMYKNSKTKKCLDVSGNEQADGLPLELYTCVPTAPVQSWLTESVTAGMPPYYEGQPAFFLRNKKTAKCGSLDFYNGLEKEGSLLMQYPCHR
ncbi:RICIN domain-containing protein [Streptosporangium sp. NPDC001559]|uniref:RICIN domain-containing protein n=1 Tax=Streptosporangium sp. NPDC001559 TaxID=3366187 RepID=UPI0036E2D759